MIVKMKKVTLLLSAREREEALVKLRRMGVLHIKDFNPPQSGDIEKLEQEVSDVSRAIGLLPLSAPGRRSKGRDEPETVRNILDLDEKKRSYIQQLEEKKENLRWFDQWGEISYASVQTLKASGILVRFYQADRAFLKKLPPDKTLHIIREEKGTAFIAYFADHPDDKLDLRETPMPSFEASVLRKEVLELGKMIRGMESELGQLAGCKGDLEAYLLKLKKQLGLLRVKYGMGEESLLVYVQGYCPLDSVKEIKELAAVEHWGYAIQDPDDPADVPTLIRNPKWLRIIDPLLKFMGTLPGYDELDISFWFLLFFSLFFAMIIGDAGYGLIYIGLTFYVSRKSRNLPREPFRLLYTLGVATFVWGLITGNWFGIEKIGRLPFLNSFIIDRIDSFAEENTMFMMYLCFIIGIVHLSLAHALRAIKLINSPVALAEVGWIGILWSVFFLAGNLVISKPMPDFTVYLFLIGLVMTLVFTNFQKNILKGIVTTLGSLPLSILSSFSDIVSYLRLFAVGVASLTVEISFNEMAMGGGIRSIGAGLIAAFILFFGHALNITLGLMSVIVHGVRLNLLEFSGHLGMQWSGKQYEPFQE